MTSSPSSPPPHSASAGSCSRTSGSRITAPGGMYGGLDTTTSTVPSRSGNASVASPSRRSTLEGREVALGPGERLGRQLDGARPAPAAPRRRPTRRSRRTRCRGRRRAGARRRARSARAPRRATASTTTSVSGRGTKTPGPTSRVRCRKYARPVRCCSGIRVAAPVDQRRRTPAPGPAVHRVVPDQVAGLDAEHVRGQEPGVVAAALDARRGQPLGGRAQQRLQAATLGRQRHAPESRSARSASTQAWTTPSRSPSSTWSRL